MLKPCVMSTKTQGLNSMEKDFFSFFLVYRLRCEKRRGCVLRTPRNIVNFINVIKGGDDERERRLSK